MDLDHALKQFDLVEANLAKLEKVLERMTALIPSGVAFMDGSPEDREYRELGRTYDEIRATLPAIDGRRITAALDELDQIAQQRLDAREVGEFECMVMVEQGISARSHQIDEYRHRFNHKRRELVRTRLGEIVGR